MAKDFFASEPMPSLFNDSELNDPTPEPQGIGNDAIHSLFNGGLSALGGMFDFVGASGIARSFYGLAQDQNEAISQAGRNALSKQIFTQDEFGDLSLGEGATDLDTWLLNIANIGGQFLGSAIPGAGLASSAVKVAKLGAKGKGVANVAGLGATGGASATGQGMEQARHEVLNMPDKLLADSPLFTEVFRGIHTTEPDSDIVEKWEAAKSALAEQVAKEVQTDPKTLLMNFGASAVSDPIIGKALLGARIAKNGALRSGLKGVLLEGGSEAAQAATQQYSINEALQPVDNRELWKGVKVAAANEGVIGGAFGGAVGSLGGAINREATPLEQSLEGIDQHRTNVRNDVDEIFSDLERPTAARQAGFSSDGEAALFGDMLTSPAQESLRNMRAETIADMVNQARQFSSPTPDDRFSPVKYQHEGEVVPTPSKEMTKKEALPGATIDSLVVPKQSRLSPANLLLPSKDIIFAEDKTDINLKTSGHPFHTRKEAIASKGARNARRKGLKVEGVPFDKGFGWRVTAEKNPKLHSSNSIVGHQIDNDWFAFSESSGTKSIPRKDMPQIKADHRGALIQYLKGKGILHETEVVDARSLKPTQLEFSPAKVEKAKQHTEGNRSILVASDGYVLDGHHQWLVAMEENEAVKIIRLDAPIEHLLNLSHEFPSSEVAHQSSDDAIVEQGTEIESTNERVSSPLPNQGQELQGDAEAFRNEANFGDLQSDKSSNIQNKEVERIRYSGDPITSPEEAASAVASIRKKAQEQMTAIVTDDDGNVLNVIRHSIGTPNSASVTLGVLSGSIVDTPNAKHVWFAHNHPSGREAQSSADKQITAKLRNLMDGSGVNVKGMIAIGRDERASFFDPENDHTDKPISIKPAVRKSSAPVSERRILKRNSLGDAVSSPQDAVNTLKESSKGKPGVLLLDQQNNPIHFETMSINEMRELRSGRLADILKAVHRSNAVSAIIATDEDGSVEGDTRNSITNLFTMLSDGGLSVLDVINVQDGASLANMRAMPRASSIFFNRTTKKSMAGVDISDAKAELSDFLERYNGLNNAGFQVEITDRKPSEVLGSGVNRQDNFYIKGAYDKGADHIFIFTQNHKDIEDIRRTLREELLVHKGLSVFDKHEIETLLGAINETRNSNNTRLKGYWRYVLEHYAEDGELVQAEELLGKIAQDKPNLFGNVWNKLLSATRRLLRKLNLVSDQITLSEIRSIVFEIGKALSQGKQTKKPNYSIKEAADSGLYFNKEVDVEDLSAKEKLGLVEQGQLSISELLKAKLDHTVDTLKDSQFWARLNEGMFDGLSGIKRAEEKAGVTDVNQQGYVSARLASGLSDILHGVFNYGAPVWKEGIVQRKEDTKGLLEVFGELGDDLNNWLAWMGAHRAELLIAEGRENNLTQSDINELKAFGKGKEKLFELVRSEYNKINSAILDLAQEAGLINEQQRKAFDEEYYVPFFRESSGVDPEVEEIKRTIIEPHTRKGIAGQSAQIKKLKGGKQSTKDLLENIITRHSSLIDAAIKNKAMLEVTDNLIDTDFMAAEESADIAAMSQQELNNTHRVRVMRNGQVEAYRVSDPALLRGLLQINNVGRNSLYNRLGRSAKRFLTTGITLSPDFIFKNFVRDAAHAWMINKDGFTFGTDSLKGLRKAFSEDESYRDLIFSGAAFQGGYIHGGDPEAGAQQIRRALRKKGLSTNEVDGYLSSFLGSGSELLEKYRGLSDKVENANRLSTYEAALANSKSKRQAAFEAKDLMDYSLQGNFTLIGTMIDTVPFFNARLQGLSKLVRSSRAQGNDELAKVLSKQLAMKGLKIAAFSLMLAALNDDEERYQELPDWDKDANWHFFIGDDHFRIPKPFELGIIFGTLPERMFHVGRGNQRASDLAKSAWHVVFNTLAMNPTPQFILPAAEVLVNKSFFRDSAIESLSDQNKKPEDRHSSYTSDTSKSIGSALGVSPKKVEHLIAGYTGTIGGYVLGASDIISRLMLGTEKAETPIGRYPVIKSFYQGDTPKTSTKFADEFYQALDAVNQAYGSYKQARKEGDNERLKELIESDGDHLRNRSKLARIQKMISKLNQRADAINSSMSMSSAEKRKALDVVQVEKNEIYFKAYTLLIK